MRLNALFRAIRGRTIFPVVYSIWGVVRPLGGLQRAFTFPFPFDVLGGRHF
jgi:hypothetical protein